MIVRIWRTGVDASRWSEYEQFEREHSRPMFQQQRGCLGVLFARVAPARAAAISFWDEQSSIDALKDSDSYKETVARLLATGLLDGVQDVEVLPLAGGWLGAELRDRV